MSEGEFFAGLQPCENILPALPSPRAVASVENGCLLFGPERELEEPAWAELLQRMKRETVEQHEPESYPGERLARGISISLARERGEHIPPEREAEWWADHLAGLDAAARTLVERKGRWRH